MHGRSPVEAYERISLGLKRASELVDIHPQLIAPAHRSGERFPHKIENKKVFRARRAAGAVRITLALFRAASENQEEKQVMTPDKILHAINASAHSAASYGLETTGRQ